MNAETNEPHKNRKLDEIDSSNADVDSDNEFSTLEGILNVREVENSDI